VRTYQQRETWKIRSSEEGEEMKPKFHDVNSGLDLKLAMSAIISRDMCVPRGQPLHKHMYQFVWLVCR
jgi:hypothetical protein